MKKVFFLLFLIILCAGCRANYGIKIDSDLKVEETMTASEDQDFYSQYSNSSVGRVISFIAEPFLDTINENKYEYKSYAGKSSGNATISKTFTSIEDYIQNTIMKSQFTDEIEYYKDGDIITITAFGNFSTSEQDQSKISVNNATIYITVPFEVVDNNADRIDNNTYFWDFDENYVEPRELKISFNINKNNYKNDDTMNRIYLLFIIAGCLILLISLGIIIYKQLQEKRENVNKI